MSGTTSKSFLAAVRLIANGCQQAFEAAEFPGLLPALTQARILLCIDIHLQQHGVRYQPKTDHPPPTHFPPPFPGIPHPWWPVCTPKHTADVSVTRSSSSTKSASTRGHFQLCKNSFSEYLNMPMLACGISPLPLALCGYAATASASITSTGSTYTIPGENIDLCSSITMLTGFT